ncbi:MAG: DUF4129 domain-containing protein [Thermoanaerobaculia bacterium]
MKRIAIVLTMVFVTGMAATLQAAMPLEQYVTALQQIRSALLAGNIEAAQKTARSIRNRRVAAVRGEFAADESLLQPLFAERPKVSMIVRRIETTVDALTAAEPPATVVIDPQLLSRIRAEDASRDPRAGGPEMPRPALDQKSSLEHLGERLAALWDEVTDLLERFFRWIARLWPHRQSTDSTADEGFPWIVAAVVGLILIAILTLAIGAWRRVGRTAGEIIDSDPLPAGAHDDDPMSREANEWERYADELAGKRRFREAIRAWYHAILVAQCRAGLLTYRKGRTNWEYVAALSHTVPWRTSFAEMTRDFEHEWYGQTESEEHVLETYGREARSLLRALRSRTEAA